MARALQRQLRALDKDTTFVHFPLQWIPIFEWTGAAWHSSTRPNDYLPLFSCIEEEDLVCEVKRARSVGQLRSLIEIVASCDIVLCETLQRIDAVDANSLEFESESANGSPIVLTNWLSYTRAEFRDYEEALKQCRPQSRSAIFLSCGRARPYEKSRTHHRLRALLDAEGIAMDRHDVIVMTSIGPVPMSLWRHPVVLRYDTGIRDVYRVLTLLRRLLHNSHYDEAWDCLSFRPYRDVLDIVAREGRIGKLLRPKNIRSRNIPVYRLHAANKL